MDCLLEFQDDIIPAHVERPLPSPSSASSSKGYKLVPWLNWTEWESVRDSLFSGSPDKVSFAIKRIETWRSRGSLPVVVDVTASIIEIQQKDPMLRKNLADNAIHSEQMLAMLYCMAILRLVNCVVEKTRKKTEISIADAAGAIGIPRTLIDIRHEGSHRDLPALPLVRDSAAKAIEWLRAFYWDPQTKQIPFQGDGSASVRKEIKSHLHELASCLKDKQHGSLLKHGKCGKHHEQLFGRGKFVSLMANKLHSSKSRGTKKQTTKILKILFRLYSSFSSEVLSVLLEFLLKALDSSNLMEHEDGQEINTLLNDWKAVIMKFANKEPELLLMLLKAVLNMIETQTTMEFDMAMQFTKLERMTGTSHVEQLSSLFAWLVGQLEGLKPPHRIDVPAETKPIAYRATLMNLLRKCLLVSSRGNKQLLDSALHLAQLMGGDSSLLEKLNKLGLLGMIDTDATGDASSLASSNKLLAKEDELIHQAAKKLESLKLRQFKSKAMKASDCRVSSSGRWVVAKSWNPCPIGMLPRELGSSGCLPDLDAVNDNEHSVDPSVRTQAWELNSCSNVRESNHSILSLDNPNAAGSSKKREASWDIPVLDKSSPKRIRESVESHGSDSTEDVHKPKGVQGCLVRNGVWKKVGEEELAAIVSGLRILV